MDTKRKRREHALCPSSNIAIYRFDRGVDPDLLDQSRDHREVEKARHGGRCANRAKRAAVDKQVHTILDNYAAHKRSKFRCWLNCHPRWTFHFVPTSCSWVNTVEGFFTKLSKQITLT